MENLNAVWCIIQPYGRFHESLCLVIVEPWNTCHHSRQGKGYVSISRTHTTHLETKTSHSHRGKQRLQGMWGSGQGGGSCPQISGEVAGDPSTCSVLPWANMCSRSFRKDATWRSCVVVTPEHDVSWRMKNSTCPALLKSFGPVLICPCSRVCSLLSQHEGASQELIHFPFQEDIFRELRHIRMYWNGAQWNVTDFKVIHTQADSESLLEVIALT